MPLDVKVRIDASTKAPSTGPALPGTLPANASNAIAQVDAGNMFGEPGTFIKNVSGWRVDRQNTEATMVNVSVQRNGVDAPSTVASVFVPITLNVPPKNPRDPKDGAKNEAVNNARNGELARVVRRGLEMSLASRKSNPNPPGSYVITRYEVTGSYSAGE